MHLLLLPYQPVEVYRIDMDHLVLSKYILTYTTVNEYMSLYSAASGIQLLKKCFSCWNVQYAVQEIMGFKKVGINTL